MLRCLLEVECELDFILALPDHLPTEYDYYLGDFFKFPKSVKKFHFSHSEFWSNESSRVQQMAKNFLRDLDLGKYDKIYCNSSTNPFSEIVQRMKIFEHLYHSPSDFIHLYPTIFTDESKVITYLKSLIKNLYLHKRYTQKPIFSPLALTIPNKFVNLNHAYNATCSDKLKQCLHHWEKNVTKSNKNILMLLSGEEPKAGEVSSYGIEKYLSSHTQGIIELSQHLDVQQHTIYIKEHKSYKPLSLDEKKLIRQDLENYVQNVEFVSEILPLYFTNLPGEILCLRGNIEIAIGEPSSLLFNVVEYTTQCYAIISAFGEVRDCYQKTRNSSFMKMNKILKNPVLQL